MTSVNLFELSAAALASTIKASIPIRRIALVEGHQISEPEINNDSLPLSEKINGREMSSDPAKHDVDRTKDDAHRSINIINELCNHCEQKTSITKSRKIESRKKMDGTLVTVADGAAQQIIVDALRKISLEVNIIGEESQEEERRTLCNKNQEIFVGSTNINGEMDCTYEDIFVSVKRELQERRRSIEMRKKDLCCYFSTFEEVESSRVSVFIDPLDGTKNYANGEYDGVTILVAIIVDNTPVFGVICKPFGENDETSIDDSECFVCYGGTLLMGGYIAGSGELLSSQPLNYKKQKNTGRALPRAVISKSRAGGVVGKCINALYKNGLVDKNPLLVDGAGEKGLRLLLSKQNEGLWFFPKPGTSLWDVAAADAILMSVGGKLTDKNGKRLNYLNKDRLNACNLDGVVASNNVGLHDTCIRIYKEAGWDSNE